MTQCSLESLFDKAKELLDSDECLSTDELEKAAEALIYFLAVPDPITKLPLKQKLVLLWAIHKNLSRDQRKELDSESFSITRILESGDYGVDIKDKLELGEGWQLLVEGDGGSGSICPGEDEESLFFDLSSLLRKLEDVDFDLDVIWDELTTSGSSSDGSTCVTPGQGIEGKGTPCFALITPSGELLESPGGSILARKDDSTNHYFVDIRVSHNDRDLEFKTEFDLEECDSVCLGYNLEWSAQDPTDSREFLRKIDDCLDKSLSMLREGLRVND